MNKEKNVLLGILAIILGLAVIVFPLISTFTLSIISGLGIMFLGVWLLIKSFNIAGDNLAAAVADLILGFIALFIGLGFLGNIAALSFITIMAIYVVGLFLILSGISTLMSAKDMKIQLIGGLGIILGILYMIIGVYAINPLFLAVLIGAFLIIAGIAELFVLPANEPAES